MEATVLTDTPASCAQQVQAIAAESGVNVKDCYQCGKCSAGCPVAPMADMMPREVIRNLQLGNVQAVLNSNMPWMCAQCGMCYARCPQSVDLPSLMLACRHEAQACGNVAISEVKKFNQLFIDGVRREGVSDEAMLAAGFNLTTGHLFQDALSAPKMVLRGMLNANGHKVSENAEVRDLIDRVRALEAEDKAQGGEQ